MRPFAARRSAGLLIAAAVGAILVATLFPAGAELAPGWTTAIVSGDDALAGVIQNVLLFVPLGVGLALGGMRGLRLVAVGTLLSLSVECAQQWIPGRDPSVGDVCFNTLGTALGGLLGRTAPLWFAPAPRRAAWQSLAAALVVAGIWFTTGWLFRPDESATTYVVTRRPDLPNRGLYPGSVVAATPGSPLPLRVVAVAGATPGRLSPLVAVTDEREREVVLLSADHTDLSLWVRTRGTDWRLDRPDLRARGALAALAPGDTFTVAAWREGGAFCLALDSRQWCDRAYTLADGWKLIFDLGHARAWILDLLAAGWLGGLLVPVGLWARRHWGSAAALLVACGSLFATPALTGLAPTPLPGLLGALAGIGLGLLLQRLPPLDTTFDVLLKPELRRVVPPRA
jgi:VanZ like protein